MKIFETEQDLNNERDVTAVLSRHFGFEFQKLDRRYQVDFLGTLDGDPKIWVEVKCRNIASTKYNSVILELDKCLTAWGLSQNTGLPALLVVRWTDAIGWIRIVPPFKTTYVVGQKANDRYGVGSPCALFMVKHFNFIT